MTAYLEPFKVDIATQVAAFASLSVEQVKSAMEAPRDPKLGDFAVNVARFQKMVKLSGKPVVLAKEWAEKIEKTEFVSSASAAGPFMNFRINAEKAVQLITDAVREQGDKFGCTNVGAGKKVVVEFSSPNIAKPFHAGHLRSTIIGNFIAVLHRKLGYDVTTINYLGDWGKQYGLLALGFKQFGDREELKKSPILHLYHVYVEINKLAADNPSIHDEARAYFKLMEEGDEEALSLWREFRELSIEEYKKIYHRLNVEFDVYSGESMMNEGMLRAVDELTKQDLLVEDNGAMIVDLKADKAGVALIKKTDGATLYITRDIAAATERHEKYNFDKMFYIVGAQQDYHFKQLFSLLKKMKCDWSTKCQHVNFGMVRGMSTRKGTVVFLNDILEEAKNTMYEKMKENQEKFDSMEDPEGVSDIVGVSAVIIQDMQAKRVKDYDFNWDRMTATDGYTGPYLQYAHARLCSIERKSGISMEGEFDSSLVASHPEVQALALEIAKYADTLESASKSCEPSHLLTYLFNLAHLITSAQQVLRVKGAEPAVAKARLIFLSSARVVLADGMKILGLRPLQSM